MNRNILIVDDSPSMRKIVRHYLEQLPDVTFFEAGDGMEAEAVIQEQAFLGDPIHLVTLDWMLPEVTGFELLIRLRDFEQFVNLPIIMVTAESLPEHSEACRKYNVSGYLTKPFTEKELLDAVHGVFDRKS